MDKQLADRLRKLGDLPLIIPDSVPAMFQDFAGKTTTFGKLVVTIFQRMEGSSEDEKYAAMFGMINGQSDYILSSWNN